MIWQQSCGARISEPCTLLPGSDEPDTVWAQIHRAKGGDSGARSLFAHRYEPVVRAYLVARWRGTPRLDDVGDAMQEVFVDFLNGALDRVDPDRPFLYGVVRNVALRAEERRARDRGVPLESEHAQALASDDDEASVVFDRAWAEALMTEARTLQIRNAASEEAARALVDTLRAK